MSSTGWTTSTSYGTAGKAAANLLKHGVTLQSACEVFFDPFVRLLRSEAVEGEEREVVAGMTVAGSY